MSDPHPLPPKFINPAARPHSKYHVLRVVLLVLLGLALLLVAGFAALLALFANALQSAQGRHQDTQVPRAVQAGAGFTRDTYTVEPGWSVEPDKHGGATIKRLRITNTTTEQATILITFTFHQGTTQVAEVQCASTVPTHDTVTMTCASVDHRFPDYYDTIKVADLL